MCVSGIELSYDYGNIWDDEFDIGPGQIRVGFPWWALPIDNYTIEIDSKTYDADFLLVTGYPGPETGEKRFGLFAISTEYIKEAKKNRKHVSLGAVQLTFNPAVYGLIDGNYVVLALQEGGVEVYDLINKTSFTSSIETELGIYKIAKSEVDGTTWWFISTYEGEPTFKGDFGNDHYFWYGPSRIFRATNLIEKKENTVWEQVYPANGKTEMGIISLNVNGTELIALEASGKIIYTSDFRSAEWKELELPSDNVWFFTDMEVDWDNGIAFISSVGDDGEGVCYVPLERIRNADSSVTCQPFNVNLPTRLVRSILLANGHLFAGTWWASVWRANSTVELLGDINGDGVVNMADLISLINIVLSNGTNDRADINGDEEVNILDVVKLLNVILG